MRAWNSYSDDLTLKDGRVVKEWTITFRTTEHEVYKRIEKFFQRLIDESNSSEKPNNSIAHDDYIESENDHLEARCLNCANSGSYKCTKCDGEMYFKTEPQTKCDNCKTYWNCQGQCDEMPQIEDEPQTERSE